MLFCTLYLHPLWGLALHVLGERDVAWEGAGKCRQPTTFCAVWVLQVRRARP